MEQKQVSLIIPMYNASRYIDDCLSSILNQTAGNAEVILVDGCSTDDTLQKAIKYPFRIIRLEKRLTPAGVRNHGAKNSSGDILVFADADVVLEPDSIKKVARLLSRPDTDAAYGIYTENTIQASFFSQLQNLVILYRCEKLPKNAAFSFSFFCAIKRKVFEEIDGYNENMVHYEDVDLGRKLITNGYAVDLNRILRRCI